MIRVEFDYNQRIIPIQANMNESFKSVVNKYLHKAELKPDSVYFIVNGQNLNTDALVGSQLDKKNLKKNNTIKILVQSLNLENKEKKLIKPKYIICPECKEPSKIKIENGKFLFYDCINAHYVYDIKIEDFEKTQLINIYDIVCDIHKDKNMGNSYQNKFFFCLTCKKNVCILCKEKHDKNHVIVNYEQKNYICPVHNSPFIKYCTYCELNLCIMCEEEHETHDTKYFRQMAPKSGEINDQILELKKVINSFIDDIDKLDSLIIKLKNMAKSFETFYQINKDILNNLDLRNTNYNILNNVNNIINNGLFRDLKKISNINNIGNKIKDIIDLYEHINSKKTISLYFVSNGAKINEIKCTSDMLFSEAVLKYFKKIGQYGDNSLRFFYNSKEIKIDTHKSLSELGLKHRSKIQVVDNNYSKTLIFNYQGNSQVIYCEWGEKIIDVMKKSYFLCECEINSNFEDLTFYYNSCEIPLCDKTLEYLGIDNLQTINVVNSKKVIGG